MIEERFSNYPQTVSDYLNLLINFFVNEDPSPIDAYKFIKSAATHFPKFPFANREILNKSEPYNLLVICDQNQGRSQIEEAILKLLAQMIGVPLKLMSAGVNATPEKYGGKPGPKVIAKMESIGIPMGDATVDQLKESDINENTILVALCAKDNIPSCAFKAKVVVVREFKDNFPGSIIPDNSDLLDFLIADTAYLALRIVARLAESIEKSDFGIFIEEFKHQILSAPLK